MNNRKRIVVFSTRDIGVPQCIFKSLKSREWFQSSRLCRFFLNKLDNKTKDNGTLSDLQSVCQGIGVQDNSELQKKFLEEIDVNLAPSNVRRIRLRLKDKSPEIVSRFEYLWNDYIPQAFVKQLNQIDYDSPNISKELLERNLNLKCKLEGPLFLYRFSLYKVEEGEDVFAVWPLDIMCETPEEQEEWFDVLSEEVLYRYKDCADQIELNLILHDTDIYPKKTFNIEKVGETKSFNIKIDENTIEKKTIIRNIAVFQHQKGEDPIATILNTPDISASKVVAEISKLMPLKPLKELSEHNISLNPIADTFKKSLEQIDGETNWEMGTYDTIVEINNKMKSILNISEDGE